MSEIVQFLNEWRKFRSVRTMDTGKTKKTRLFKYLNGIGLIINWKTFVIVFLSIVSTAFCLRYEIKADFPLTLIGTAIVFPIVFSIGGAYKRREVALDEYGSIKAHGRALFFAASHWLENPPEELRSELKIHLECLLNSCREIFTHPISELEIYEKEVYNSFQTISVFIKSMRSHGMPSTEAAKSNQFLSKMMLLLSVSNTFTNTEHHAP